MPFTLSHTVAVLPVSKRNWASATGLFIGSMVPDFEYFFRLRVFGIYGHTFWGMFWFDLPVAILLAYAFHYLVKPVLLPNLPPVLQRKWSGWNDFNWHGFVKQNWIIVIVSVLFGTATHLLWDAFTHNNTIIVRAIPALSAQVDLGFEEYPVWHLLQQISSAAGLIILIFYVIRLPETGDARQPGKSFWTALVILVLSIMTWKLVEISNQEILKIGHFAVIGMGAAMYGLLLISGIYQLFIKSKYDI